MRKYKTYRNGWKGDPASLPGAIRAVIEDFTARYGAAPKSVVIHPTMADVARAVLVDAGLAGLEVQPVGGCLLGEMWLEAPSAPQPRQLDLLDDPGRPDQLDLFGGVEQ